MQLVVASYIVWAVGLSGAQRPSASCSCLLWDHSDTGVEVLGVCAVVAGCCCRSQERRCTGPEGADLWPCPGPTYGLMKQRLTRARQQRGCSRYLPLVRLLLCAKHQALHALLGHL
jgi:hypothetical protein